MDLPPMPPLHVRLKKIREALGYTQGEFGDAMPVPVDHSWVSRVEKGNSHISPNYLDGTRTAANAEFLPLADHEFPVFNQNVYKLRELVRNGDDEAAKALQPKLELAARFSFVTDCQVQFNLTNAVYCRTYNDMDGHGSMMLWLKEHEKDFFYKEEHALYELELGASEQLEYRYKPALAHYFEAERLGLPTELDIGTFYYNSGVCLKDMGYPYLSNPYFEKALQLADKRGNYRYIINVKCYQAFNYSMTNRFDDAHKILSNCRLEAKTKRDMAHWTAIIDGRTGLVYQNAGNYDNALAYFDSALKYHKKGSDIYVFILCHKASTLFAMKKPAEALKCIEEGLSMAKKGSIWQVWLQAMKDSMTLNVEKCLKYIQFTAIPKFLEHGENWLAIKFHLLLSEYYKKINKRNAALEHHQLAFALQEKLLKGDLGI